ncbi:Piwi domain-containing protein [Amycolatopsis sp. NPDC089917]|uniref:argonaute/piwi family protein n=1 Tax=Amycolatopsis sp. NPDC089917 TaxID=3155187 RepID=UPI0034200797
MSGPLLAFNFLPVKFTSGAFKGGLVDFVSHEHLDSLRAELAETHVVSRTRGGVACIPLTDDAEERGTPTTFVTREYQRLTMKLVQQALMRSVVEWGYKLQSPRRAAFVSRSPDKDLLVRASGNTMPGALSDLHVYPQYSLDSRTIGPNGGPGVIVTVKTRYEIDLTVEELITRGVAVRGLYVVGDNGTYQPFPDMDPYGTRRTVGAIDRVDGTDLVLRDAPGATRIPAGEAWLESRREVFNNVTTSLGGAGGARILRQLDQEAFGLMGASGRLKKTTEIANWLSKDGQLPIARDLAVVLGQPVGTSDESRATRWTRYDEPVFTFDQAGDKTHRSVDRGLNAYGPFDVEFFAKKKPRIAVVMPREHKGIVENFLTKFLNGVPGDGVFSQGFIRKYHLTGYEIHLEPFDGGPTDARAYREACQSALQSGEIDLAIVITSEAQVHLTGNDSPYLVAKSVFMGQGVPVQEIQVETARMDKLAHPLNTIALASYAKLGGIPFVIAAPRALAQELVIGIGSAHVKASRNAEAERVVGITTVFSADGNYLLSSTSREADYDEYPRELLRSLTESINAIKSRNAWDPTDEIRLMFHVFKPLKDAEATAVKDLVRDLTGRYAKVEFAFVQISTDHDWVMFDRASTGTSGSRGPAKGYLVPERGYAVPIGRDEMLVTVSGPMDIKSPLHGAPKPMRLKLHRESTFTDIEYLSRQAFRFTAMSWRRMYPSNKPVTILYSDLIAGLLGHLRHVRNWNADAVTTKLRWSRWFL